MRYRREPRRPHGGQGYWLLRFMRAWRLDRNPLRRGSDRAETLILAFLVAAFLAAAPFAIGAAGGYVHAVAARAQHSQIATRHRVDAVTTAAAPQPDNAYGAALIDPEVTVRWTAPDGKAGTGQLPVPPGTSAGTRIPVWTTNSGALAAPPLRSSEVSDLATMAEVGAGLVLAVTALLAIAALHGLMNRRRLAGWDADWLAADSPRTPWR